MTYHSNHYAEITHPVTEDIVEAYLSFEYIPYYRGDYDTPVEYGSVEIDRVMVDGEDIIGLFSPYQISGLESDVYGAGWEEY